jgi:hypothetical protein
MSGVCKYCGKGLTQNEMADHAGSCKEMNRDYQPDDIGERSVVSDRTDNIKMCIDLVCHGDRSIDVVIKSEEGEGKSFSQIQNDADSELASLISSNEQLRARVAELETQSISYKREKKLTDAMCRSEEKMNEMHAIACRVTYDNANFKKRIADLEQQLVEKDADIKALIDFVEKFKKINETKMREGYELARWLVKEQFDGTDLRSFEDAIAARDEAKGEDGK